MNTDLENSMLKNRILSENKTFKTAFVATLGFYAGQFVSTVIGFTIMLGLIFVLYKMVH